MKPLRQFLILGILSLINGSLPVPAATTPPDTNVSTNTVGVVAVDATALAGSSSGAFIFVRTGATNDDLNVPFAYSGTGVPGTDFDDADSKAGASGTRYLKIP